MDTIQKINYPSFFRIMVGDFSTQLGVPPAFEKDIEKMMNQRRDDNCYFSVSLKFVVGLEAITSWKVKVEKGSGGLYYFTRGWSKIVKDLQLERGDFLVFYLVADYAFQLAVYDPTSRLKINHPPTTSEVKTNTQEKVMEKEEECKKIISCSVKYTEPASRRSCYILPKWFGEEIYKECNEEDEEVLIKDDEGREWGMKLKLRVQPTYYRYELNAGWTDFCKSSNVAVGDTFEFKHIQGSTIAVRVLHRNE